MPAVGIKFTTYKWVTITKRVGETIYSVLYFFEGKLIGAHFTRGHFLQHKLTQFRAWISNCIHCFVWDVFTHPYPDLN